MDSHATALRVNTAATGTPVDGSSWDQAYRTLQDALDASAPGDELWLVEGTYVPALGEPQGDWPARGITFMLRAAVAIYGGYTLEGKKFSKRDPILHTSVISGDVNGNDAEYDVSENSFHVLSFAGGDGPAILDGVTVSGGYADGNETDGNGGGVLVSGGTLIIRNCTFDNNVGLDSGGAIYSSGATLNIEKSRFTNHMGSNGGAIFITSGNMTLSRVLFSSNYCVAGGGIYVADDTTVSATNCVFAFNGALNNGGGLYASANNTVTFLNCTFTGNHADDINGYGGAVFSQDSHVNGENTIFYGDTTGSDEHLELYDAVGGRIALTNCIVECGWAGTDNQDIDPRLRAEREPNPGQLACNSPALDAATAAAPNDDILGTPRPLNAGPDIGAYEYHTDTDGGGLPDDYEQDNNLIVNDPSDDTADSDGDNLDNCEEFRRGSNPQDPTDPQAHFYVDPAGSDWDNDGSETSPWQTISHALFNVPEGLPIFPITIHLAPGVYEEPIILMPYVFLAGAGQDQTTIQYYDIWANEHIVVEAARGSGISDCTITLPGAVSDVSILLRAIGVPVALNHVRFDAQDNLFSVAIQVSEPGASDTKIEECTVRRVHFGIQSTNAAPIIRWNTFEDIREDAIFVREPETKDGEGATPRAGDVTDERTGYNSFENIGNMFVQNLSATLTKAELNYYGEDYATEETIEEKMGGAVDFQPFLAGAVLGSSVYCCLWDNASPDHPPVENASIVLQPLGATITQNDQGIYVFPAVPAGEYTVTVDAPGYASCTRTVMLTAGGMLSLSFSMTVSEEGENEGAVVEGEEEEGEQEGEGEEEPRGCCGGLISQPPQNGLMSKAMADIVLIALTAGMMPLCSTKMRRKKQHHAQGTWC